MQFVRQLDRYFFNPKSVVIIGASATFGKWGFNVLRQALSQLDDRRIYPVNEEREELFGLKCYKNINEIPEPVDLTVITIPAKGVPKAMKACVQKGVKFVIIISAGFGESEGGGTEIQKEVVRIAKNSGIRFLGPNCMGCFNTATNLNTTALIPYVKKGRVSLISQSGNFGVAIVQLGMEMGLGFSKFISTGNEADLHLEDFLEYLGQDEETKVIVAYIEGLREGRRFFSLAKKITKKKPIVVMKMGKSQAGAKAALSHTSALAGEDAIHDSAFRQAGVIRVDSTIELVDTVGALLRQPIPRGKRVGILTGGGGFGVVAADLCGRLNLELPSPSPSTIAKLSDLLPSFSSRFNPVDTASMVDPAVIYPCLKCLLEDENMDAIFAVSSIGVNPFAVIEELPHSIKEKAEQLLALREEEELRNLDEVIKLMDEHQKPVIVSSMLYGTLKDSKAFKKLNKNQIMVYSLPERAAKVLANLVEYGEYLNEF